MVGKAGRSGRRKGSDGASGGPAFPPMDQQEPPEWLDARGREKWFDVVGILTQIDGLVSNSDRDVIALYCDAFSRMLDVTEKIGEDWSITSAATGGQYLHPLVGVRNRAVDEMKTFIRELGLSPAARAALKVSSSGSTNDPEILRFNRALRHRAG